MSCEWRHISDSQWELTQSNPPSELPHDPINSSSSNPDERSSSPTAHSEQARSPRNDPSHQTGESLFSYAAQAETEPIPRDSHLPNPEDMLIPDSPSHPNLASDFDDHIASLRPNEAETMQAPKRNSKNSSHRENIAAAESDPEDPDFDLPESDEEGSDSSYVAEPAPRRGKKRSPVTKTRGKAAVKPRATRKGNAQNNSALSKKSRGTTATKVQPQKVDTATKVSSKRKQAVNVTNAQNQTTKTSASPAGMSGPKSRRGQGGEGEDDLEQPDKIIPDSQASFVDKQTKRKQPTPRLPKKSFFDEPEDRPSAQGTDSGKPLTKSQVSSNAVASKKQSSSNRNRVRPASPIKINDDSEYDGDDLWDNPESPGRREHNKPPDVHTGSQASPVILEEVVGPNSKKKRSPVRSDLKPKNAKASTTRTYGQKPTQNLSSRQYFRDSENRVAKHSQPAEPTQPKNQETDSVNQSASFVLGEVIDLSMHTEGESESIEQEFARPIISQEPASQFIASDHHPQPRIDIAPESPKPPGIDAPAISKKRLPAPAPVKSIVKKETKSAAPQPLEIQEKPVSSGRPSKSLYEQHDMTSSRLNNNSVENHSATHQVSIVQQSPDHVEVLREVERKAENPSNRRIHPSVPSQRNSHSQDEAYPRDIQEDSGNIDVYIDQPQKDPVSIEERRPFPPRPDGHQQVNEAPTQASRQSMVNESGSPLQHSRTAMRSIAPFGREPLQELQQPTSHSERFRVPAEIHESVDSHLLWNPQRPLNFEYQPARRYMPLPTRQVQPLAHNNSVTRLNVAENQENVQPVTNYMPRLVLSPSSSVKHSAEKTKSPVPQAPQLHPKSIDFAHRAAQRQKQMYYNQEVDAPSNEMIQGQPAEQLSWFQSDPVMRIRNNSKLLPAGVVKSVNSVDGLSSRCNKRQGNPSSKPKREAQWQDAVDAASGGVVDTLHLISTNLLEHLRTREQSVFAVINEYKRNGTKISEKLAKRQTGELLNASATAEQKCLELATLYGSLSKTTQDFRAEILSRHRNQAYTEWQRETARIKGVMRAAREEAALGRG